MDQLGLFSERSDDVVTDLQGLWQQASDGDRERFNEWRRAEFLRRRRDERSTRTEARGKGGQALAAFAAGASVR